MAVVQNPKDRYFPQHPTVDVAGKKAVVNPELLNQHQRLAFDKIYDMQVAMQNLVGGATGLALFAAGAVTGVLVMFPGFGYTSPPAVVISGGGGSGAKAVAVIKQGRVSAINVTAGGAGYTSTPTVTLTP